MKELFVALLGTFLLIYSILRLTSVEKTTMHNYVSDLLDTMSIPNRTSELLVHTTTTMSTSTPTSFENRLFEGYFNINTSGDDNQSNELEQYLSVDIKIRNVRHKLPILNFKYDKGVYTIILGRKIRLIGLVV